MAMEEDEGRGYCYAGRESTLKHMLCGGNFLTRPPTGRYFSPAPPSDCFAIDFPGHAISPGEGYRLTHIQRDGWCDFHCAHRATTAIPSLS
jgi:hypothetical protein